MRSFALLLAGLFISVSASAHDYRALCHYKQDDNDKQYFIDVGGQRAAQLFQELLRKLPARDQDITRREKCVHLLTDTLHCSSANLDGLITYACHIVVSKNQRIDVILPGMVGTGN